MKKKEDSLTRNSRVRRLAALWNSHVTVNVAAIVVVFLMFLSSQSLLLTTLVDAPVFAETRETNILWIGTALHAVLVLLLTLLLSGAAANLLPRGGRAAMWAMMIVSSTLLLWDFVAYQLIHEHVFNAARLLWENVFLDRQMMHSRKVPLLLILAGYLFAFTGGAALFYFKEAKWQFLAWKTPVRSAVIALAITSILAISFQAGARQFLRPKLYRASLQSNLSISRFLENDPPDADTLFRIRSPHFHPPPRTENVDLTVSDSSTPAAPKPDIFFFVIESLRSDSTTADITPHLRAFSEKSLPIAKTVANANQTHFSLTAILHGLSPFYCKTFFEQKNYPGAVPVRVLKNLGYKIKVFASPDLYYFRFAKTTFGPNHELADCYVDQKEILQRGYFKKGHNNNPAAIDQFIVQELMAELARPREGPSFYFVMLDSSHIDYYWGDGFQPRFKPYSEGVSLVPLDLRASQIDLLRNRYKNAVAYVDDLMGKVLNTLEQSGNMDRSIVVITGDHGEEFLERGHMVHGSEPNHYQLNVPIWIRFPQGFKMPARPLPIASHVDIFPTVFDYLKISGEFRKSLSGKSLLSATPPSWAVCVEHAGQWPTAVVLDQGDRKLWLEISGNQLVGRTFAARHLTGVRIVNADDEEIPVPKADASSSKVPKEFIPALQELITYP